MRFFVHHWTRYEYDVPVRLGAHVLRLTPQAQGVRVHRHDVTLSPTTVDRREATDAFGNRVTEVRFGGETRALAIESTLELDSEAPPDPQVALPPLPWGPSEGDGLHAYRASAPAAPTVRALAEEVATAAAHRPLAFLDLLAETLHARIDRRIRPAGAAMEPAETLAMGAGACRDQTSLFLAACRSQGMAGRFVSGYQAHSAMVTQERYLHAWPEVHLPGVGFRGWDPTHGRRTGADHVALCGAPDQADTMPVAGTYAFDGPELTSTLTFGLRIRTT